mgnify:CR=1 FL=1
MTEEEVFPGAGVMTQADPYGGGEKSQRQRSKAQKAVKDHAF